jgi:hypothetical protein
MGCAKFCSDATLFFDFEYEMLIIYAVGGYVGKLGSVPIEKIHFNFEHCDSIEFFSDKNVAKDLQFKSANSENCRVLFEVEVQVNLNSKVAYVSRLIKASIIKTKANLIEITLDHPLKPMHFSLTKKQCIALRINFKPALDNVLTFLLCNNQIKEPSLRLLPEINSKIFSYYNRLVFFKQQPQKLTSMEIFTKTAKNLIHNSINVYDVYAYNKQKILEDAHPAIFPTGF